MPLGPSNVPRARIGADAQCRLQPYLPDEILWRQKEQFSDGELLSPLSELPRTDPVLLAGVGYSWIDGLKDYASKSVSDEQMSKAAERWSLDTPETKEAYLIRQLFEGHFPSEAAAKTAVRWIPRAVRLPCLRREALYIAKLTLTRTRESPGLGMRFGSFWTCRRHSRVRVRRTRIDSNRDKKRGTIVPSSGWADPINRMTVFHLRVSVTCYLLLYRLTRPSILSAPPTVLCNKDASASGVIRVRDAFGTCERLIQSRGDQAGGQRSHTVF